MGDKIQGWQGRRDIRRDDDNDGGVGADRGMVLPAKARAGHGEGISADGITRWRDDEIQMRLTAECPAVK